MQVLGIGDVNPHMGRKHRKDDTRKVARDRLDALLAFARKEALGPEPERADRALFIARKLGRRFQMSLPKHSKHLACKGCGTFQVPGRTSRIRFQKGRRIHTCLSCGRVHRRPLKD